MLGSRISASLLLIVILGCWFKCNHGAPIGLAGAQATIFEALFKLNEWLIELEPEDSSAETQVRLIKEHGLLSSPDMSLKIGAKMLLSLAEAEKCDENALNAMSSFNMLQNGPDYEQRVDDVLMGYVIHLHETNRVQCSASFVEHYKSKLRPKVQVLLDNDERTRNFFNGVQLPSLRMNDGSLASDWFLALRGRGVLQKSVGNFHLDTLVMRLRNPVRLMKRLGEMDPSSENVFQVGAQIGQPIIRLVAGASRDKFRNIYDEDLLEPCNKLTDIWGKFFNAFELYKSAVDLSARSVEVDSIKGLPYEFKFAFYLALTCDDVERYRGPNGDFDKLFDANYLRENQEYYWLESP